MKSCLSNLLQDAAFPAVVLAFACAPLNHPLPDVRTHRPLDQGLRPLLDRLRNEASRDGPFEERHAKPLSEPLPLSPPLTEFPGF
jgi:hypothetical protein